MTEKSMICFGFFLTLSYLCIMNLKDQRIAVLLSGGVDSSVVLYELVRQGLRPDCFYIKIGPEEEEEWDCSSEEDLEMATAVSHKYGCNLEIIDCHQEYWDQVTAYTMEKVRAGLTPNPDVMCNRLIKFGAFDEKRGHEYDLIATGHYAQTEIDEEGRKWLTTSPDPVKDQTDFLAQIYDWQLRKALFPIGHMMKEEVRVIAEREHLVNAKRKDSQGICFLGKINYNDYIRRYLGEKPGDVLELETGKRIGQHKGLWFHTIGQRHGLGFGGGPWFVVKKDMLQNILYVSKGYDPQTAYKQEFRIHDLHLLTAPIDTSTICFKIRHTPEFHRAKMETIGDGVYQILSDTPIHGVAPGQFCVLYDEAHHRCYGSGEITV
jgi:tRNA-specific 2-thiouridylase